MNMNTTPTHCMADIETLGNRAGCIIMSIGAVKFNADGITERFYVRIDMELAQKEGFHFDADTVKWWLQQSEEARNELIKPGGLGTYEALEAFNEFIGDQVVFLWGNGAGFDNPILAEAYRHLGLWRPWKFWNDRCYRTVKALHPDMPMQKRTGTHHNALDDAISQAEHLITLPSFRAMCEWEKAPKSKELGVAA